MTFKKLSEVLRNPKLYAQTKALYCYLFIRADHKRDIAYPPKNQILQELNLTDKLFTEGLRVLELNNYIKVGTAEGLDAKTNKSYIYTTYTLIQ